MSTSMKINQKEVVLLSGFHFEGRMNRESKSLMDDWIFGFSDSMKFLLFKLFVNLLICLHHEFEDAFYLCHLRLQYC